MSEKQIDAWVETFLKSRTWLSKRYSPERMLETLELWIAAFQEEAEAVGVSLADTDPLEFFRPSYLRLSPGRNHEEQLRSRARTAVERISKRALLNQIQRVPGIDTLDAARLEKWSHRRIASRFSKWEEAVRTALPDISDEEVFRFFRLRYLYLPEDRFLSQAIPRGVKNSVEYHNRMSLLEQLGISPRHPQYDQWLPLAQWQFRRKAKKLKEAVRRFWDLRLGFPPTSESINQRDYHRYLKICAGGDSPDVHEEMIYKLLLYFEGMTIAQLKKTLAEAPKASPWNSYDLNGALGELVELGLVEEKGTDTIEWYQPSQSIQTEIILETWLQRLRSEIRIGTREALEYLPSGYQRQETSVIARRYIPRATERIMRERRRLVSELGIDRNDARFGELVGLSRREMEDHLSRFRRVIEAFKSETLEIPRVLEKQLEIFLDEDLKPGDRDVFALVVGLETVSIHQISRILKRHGGKRRGFALKSSLKRLCSVELLSQDEEGLFFLHPTLKDLSELERPESLPHAVGLF